MIFEICTDSVEGAISAEKYGAKRIELCAALSVGGLTPNYGLVKTCTDKSSVEVHTMIRHKEGGFNYNSADVDLMKIDIRTMKKAGARGVVFGILSDDNTVSELNRELVRLSKSLGLEVTFHRAFDFISDYKKAIKGLIDMKFDRLLTSGLKPSVVDGLDVISYLQENHGSKIQIMAGSGVNAQNALEIAKTGIQNLHFTARKSLNNPTNLSMGELMVVDKNKMIDIISLFQEVL